MSSHLKWYVEHTQPTLTWFEFLESILCLSSCFFYCNQVSLLADYLEKWEKDNKAELIIIKVSSVSSGKIWIIVGNIGLF